MAMGNSPLKNTNDNGHRRKNSDDYYYVEETLLFTYNPDHNTPSGESTPTSPIKKKSTQAATQLHDLI